MQPSKGTSCFREKRLPLQYPQIPVGDFLRQTARRLPGKVALIDPRGKRELTFADIERESEQLAGTFFEWGVKKGDRIALFLMNSWEFFVGFYAALKVGAVASPVNPTFREDQFAHQINDSGARILLIQHDLLPFVRPALKDLRSIEKMILTRGRREAGAFTLSELLGRPPGLFSLAQPALRPKLDLAVLPYSSGTTGLTKGVMISHFNLVANAIQVMQAVEAREEDIFISFLPFNHIYGLTYFLCGGIHLGSAQVVMDRFSAEECLRLIERYRVTLLFAVPPTLLALLNMPDIRNYDLSSLRYIWVGAAPLPSAIARRIHQILDVPVALHYGLSEASPTTHVNPPRRVKEGSVGTAVSDLEDRIMDMENGEKEVSPGEMGELAVRGPNVFQGYWNHPEDNKLALRDGWLYTGDIARMDEEGYVYILDRRKEMIRGQRPVAPAELEAVLMEHPAVRDCAVVGVSDKTGEVPKAFVALHEGVAAELEELIDFVGERVEPYKRVREVALVSEIPRNLSGKILRRILKGA